MLGLMVGTAQPIRLAFAATTVTDCPTTEAALTTDITNAGSGGTVAFNCTSATTIPFDSAHGGTGPITVTQDLTLDASGAASTVTFDGGNSTQLFVVNSGVSFSLIHLTLQNGSDANGAGGAIYSNGTVSITNCTLSNNSATSYNVTGGAIDSTGTLTITASTFSDNSAIASNVGYGGAVLNGGGTVSIANSTFSGNFISPNGGQGGALFNEVVNGGGTVSIANSTFSGNSVPNTGSGGAIENNGPMTITASTFSSNSAHAFQVYGGGAIDNLGPLTITASTFSGNSATVGGAIEDSQRGTVSIANSTLSGNSASNNGGGGAIENNSGTAISIGGSIIANSTGGNCFGTISDNGYNLTDSNGDCGLTGTTDLTNTNPQLASLAGNGGSTQTMALLNGSPAIDYIPSISGLCASTDQRGVPRPDNSETACDIGAYESRESSLVNGSFETGTSPWFINTHNGGSATLSQDSSVHYDGSDAGKVVVSSVGSPANDWNLQLGQTGLSLTSGTTYLLSYEAQSTTANRVVRAALQQDASPYMTYATSNCTLGAANTWHRCTLTFTPSSNLTGVDLWLNVGQAADTVWFDAVSVTALGTNRVANGSFESGTSPWFINLNRGATTSASNVVQDPNYFSPNYSGAITITNRGAPAHDYNVQLGQTGFSLTGGSTYTLYYEAQATTANRVVRATLQQDVSPYTQYATSSCTLGAVGTWTQCSLTFAPSTNLTGVDLWFNLAQNVDTVYLDDISMTSA